jgi:F-type H+-transporting ATPase subunit b
MARLMSSLLSSLAALLLLAGLSGHALAEAPAMEEGAAAHASSEVAHGAGHEEDSGGLPQFDTSKFPSQIFWLVICFGLTYALMRYVALPKVESALALRGRKMDQDIEEAKRINIEAKKLISEYEGRLAKARGQAQEVHQLSAEDNNRKSAMRMAEQQKIIDSRMTEAEKRIADAKAKALETLDREAESVVSELVARIAGVAPDTASVQTAIRNVKKAASA